MLLSGAPYRPADTAGERVAGVLDAFDAAGRAPAMIYAYDSDLDSTGHRHGVAASAWRHQLSAVDALAEQLADALPPDCVLLVTGDHGMVDAGPEDHVDVEATPGLMDDVVLVGEPRFRHVYTADGAQEDVAGRWSSALGRRALVRTREQAQADGWFGPIDERVRDRIGDVVVAGLEQYVFLLPSVWPREARMKGHHGSVTDSEMLVPCLVATA